MTLTTIDIIKQTGWDDQMAQDLSAATRQALFETTTEMAKAATHIARERQRPGNHRKMQEITELTVFEWSDGWEGGIISPAWYAWFQNDGTLGSRKKKLKKATLERRSSRSGQARYAKVSGNKGITPLGFFDAAIKVARKDLKARIDALT